MPSNRILRMAALCALAIGIAYLLASPLPQRLRLALWVWTMLFLGTVSVLAISLAVHETGHWIAGRREGFRFLLFIVGPLRIEAKSTGLELGWNRSLALSGGLCIMTPDDDVNLPRRVSRMIAGGPAASLALTLIAASLSAVFLGHPFGAWLSVLSLGSALVFLATVAPMKAGHFYTDGARALMLRRGGPEAERWCAMMALIGVAMGPVRPRDWHPGQVQAMLWHLDESYDGLGALMMAYQWSLDRGKISEARRWLEQALSKRELWPRPFRAPILLEASYFHALYGGQFDHLRRWLEEARGGVMIEPYTRLRAEAAVLLAEGHYNEARQTIDAGRRILARESDTGLVIAEKAWLANLDSALPQPPRPLLTLPAEPVLDPRMPLAAPVAIPPAVPPPAAAQPPRSA